MKPRSPDHGLQRTPASRRGCNRRVLYARHRSLSYLFMGCFFVASHLHGQSGSYHLSLAPSDPIRLPIETRNANESIHIKELQIADQPLKPTLTESKVLELASDAFHREGYDLSTFALKARFATAHALKDLWIVYYIDKTRKSSMVIVAVVGDRTRNVQVTYPE
jgi:hypothetical protein